MATRTPDACRAPESPRPPGALQVASPSPKSCRWGIGATLGDWRCQMGCDQTGPEAGTETSTGGRERERHSVQAATPQGQAARRGGPAPGACHHASQGSKQNTARQTGFTGRPALCPPRSLGARLLMLTGPGPCSPPAGCTAASGTPATCLQPGGRGPDFSGAPAQPCLAGVPRKVTPKAIWPPSPQTSDPLPGACCRWEPRPPISGPGLVPAAD